MDQSIERWLPVVGYEGLYEVSDQGRVRRNLRVNAYGRTLVEKIMRGSRVNGYHFVELSREGRRVRVGVHRIVLIAFDRAPLPNEECRHLDGDPSNNRLSNLAWGTSSENNLDQVKHGTHPESTKTHCNRAHLLAAPNLVESRRPARICKACTRARHYLHCNPESDRGVDALSDEFYDHIVNNAPNPVRTVPTHCHRGHELKEPNLVASRIRDGHRVCLACSRGRARAHQRPDVDVDDACDAAYAAILSTVSA